MGDPIVQAEEEALWLFLTERTFLPVAVSLLRRVGQQYLN